MCATLKELRSRLPRKREEIVKEHLSSSTLLELFFFKLSCLVVLNIFGTAALCGVALIFYRHHFVTYPTGWIVGSGVFILIGWAFISHRASIQFSIPLAYAFAGIPLLYLLSAFIPIQSPELYVELFKKNGDVIVDDFYCASNSEAIDAYKKDGYKEGEGFYSWRLAELSLRHPFAEDSSCYPERSSDAMFLVGLMLEMSFSLLPAVLLLVVLSSLIHYCRPGSTDYLAVFLGDNFLDGKVKVRQTNVAGIALLVIVILYNAQYISTSLNPS